MGLFLKLLITLWCLLSYCLYPGPLNSPVSKRVNPGPLTKSRLTFFGVHSGNFHWWSLLSFPWWRGLFLKLMIMLWYLPNYYLYLGPLNSPGSKRVKPDPLTKSRLDFFEVHRGNFHRWRLLSFPWWQGLILKLLKTIWYLLNHHLYPGPQNSPVLKVLTQAP